MVESGQVLETVAQGATGGEGFPKSFRAGEGEDFARARLGVALVGEAGEDAGGLVEEGQRAAGGLDPLQFGRGVVRGLFLDRGDGVAESLLLGLDDTDGLAVHEEDVVGRAGVGGVFADGLALAGVMVPLILGLHGPA